MFSEPLQYSFFLLFSKFATVQVSFSGTPVWCNDVITATGKNIKERTPEVDAAESVKVRIHDEVEVGHPPY